METFFTSDLHLGHENILLHRTQFGSLEEHDEYVIARWNEKVAEKDEVYILGDLSFRATNHISYYLNRMKGKKHLIIGNHDGDWMRRVEDMAEYFVSVDMMKQFKFEKKKITLCHYPMLEWSGSHHVENASSFLIHGHIHNIKKPEVYGYIQKYQPHALNAGVDINHFQPVTFEELKENCNVWYGRGFSST